MKKIPLNERIIVALDVDTPDEAKAMVKRCEGHTRFFKIGLQLFTGSWFETVDWLVDRGHKVMLDLKFFDIPETVRKAVGQLRDRGISLTTVHGNDSIVRAAVEATKESDLRLLAITVLTSLGEEDIRAMGMSVADLVFLRAQRALELGCDGVVCSGREAQRIRHELGEKLLIVTPGIRPGASLCNESDDQTRIVTAAEAISNGASHLVVGRPITGAADPAAVIARLQAEIAGESG